jgi:thioredoxin reductase (NADPH)
MNAAGAGFAPVDLLVIGAGPTGIAVGAEAKRAGLSVQLVDRGPLVASLVDYPNEMTFFTTRERLEIAGVPFAVPEDKPNRRQAIVYYQAVAASHRLPLALHEDVVEIVPRGAHAGVAGGGFDVVGRGRDGATVRRADAVVVATGYFCNPRRLGVPGEERDWVRARFRDPLPHWGEDVVVIGAGNSGAEAALELYRHGARVTLVHRGPAPKSTVKYWVKPDLENRIEEGSIAARFGARVLGFGERTVEIDRAGQRESIPADAAYVLIGYAPETGLLERAGVPVDPANGVPEFDPVSCETPVPGLFVAGTVQAGRETHRIFIENSREHAPRIVEQLLRRRGTSLAAPAFDPVTLAGGKWNPEKEQKR